MDLWIRSQDKTTLLKVDEINLFELESFCRLETPTCVLGDYKTKERALEVLDEINERIMIMNTFKLIGIQNEKIAFSFLSVFNEEKLKGIAYPYEMPKE